VHDQRGRGRYRDNLHDVKRGGAIPLKKISKKIKKVLDIPGKPAIIGNVRKR